LWSNLNIILALSNITREKRSFKEVRMQLS
jgi:hypothetical protein